MTTFDQILRTHRVVANEGRVAVLPLGDGDPTLTPGEASALATALQEASKVAVRQAKEIRQRAESFAAAGGPKHEEMF